MCVDGAQRGLSNSRFVPGDPVSACHSPGKKSVVVEVTDSCPCVYPVHAARRVRRWRVTAAVLTTRAQPPPIPAARSRIEQNNAASNKQWCCGDVPHFDLSYAVRHAAHLSTRSASGTDAACGALCVRAGV
jgi:hypothetical protein